MAWARGGWAHGPAGAEGGTGLRLLVGWLLVGRAAAALAGLRDEAGPAARLGQGEKLLRVGLAVLEKKKDKGEERRVGPMRRK